MTASPAHARCRQDQRDNRDNRHADEGPAPRTFNPFHRLHLVTALRASFLLQEFPKEALQRGFQFSKALCQFHPVPALHDQHAAFRARIERRLRHPIWLALLNIPASGACEFHDCSIVGFASAMVAGGPAGSTTRPAHGNNVRAAGETGTSWPGRAHAPDGRRILHRAFPLPSDRAVGAKLERTNFSQASLDILALVVCATFAVLFASGTGAAFLILFGGGP